ncbi:hypothetical protein [Roseisolibacter sp. H3M3-2]|uniref:hypothetical protein n=1 Tax=Roseisolibacter sp. H3M3-2 TaxID=3031323 RepID=UPI0023DA0C6C|nr:hypothetical protein [Roseisolibacter sp. H3M3-2]MDF1503031.1 hypothetical protein [Roseisolibacter sp. H3M3-2]
MTGAVAAPRPEGGAPWWVARGAFVLAAAAFALLTRYVYVDVLVAARVFEYMGVRANDVSWAGFAPFLALAVLPACWMRPHLRGPSDVAQMFLYYAVHVQTAVLMPLVSQSPIERQLLFCLAVTAAVLALDARVLLPRLAPPPLRPSRRAFALALAAFWVIAMVSFARSGYLSLDNVKLADVYDQRAELRDRAAELGKVFFYAANWTGAVVAPFLIVIGLHTRRWWLPVAATALAVASFVASSNRSNAIAIPAAIGGYYFLRMTRGRHLGALMGVGFCALTGALLMADVYLGVTFNGTLIPAVSFQIFHRTFTNNGYLTAIYLDTFFSRPPALYADSFLRWVPGPTLEAPVPIIAGATFTDVLGNFANANLWADAYANLGYPGLAFSAVFTALVFWAYDGFASRADRVVAAALLVVPATVLANTATQTALTSNGLMLLFPLVLGVAARRSPEPARA